MNDFDPSSRAAVSRTAGVSTVALPGGALGLATAGRAVVPSTVPAIAAAPSLVPRPHPTRVAAPSADSGPAVTRDFQTRLHYSDFAVVLAAAVTAVGASATTDPPQLALLVVVVGGWLAALWIFRTRDSSVLGVGIAEYRQVVSATTMTFGTLGIALGIAQIDNARFFFLIAFPFGLVALVVERWIWRKWLARRSVAGKALSRVLVVGNRADVEYVIGQIGRKLGLAYSVVGAVVESGNLDGHRYGEISIPLSHNLDDVAATAARLGADTVIVAGAPRARPKYVQELSWSLEGTATHLILATSLANVAGPRIHLRPVEGLPLIHVEIPRFEGGKHALKRGFDVAVAAMALVVLAPLFAIVAAAIRLDSPGPVLFRQERVGRDGTLFTMLKFRSMVMTAEADLAALRDRNEGAGALFKLRDDPRVTRVGRFIRKHSVDELPQLWNIIVGDMSIVGPRPPLASEVMDYEEHVHRRLYIRPGLTGMWQVNGRSTLDWEESVKLDLFYVENWSLVGDVVIMWRTLREVRAPMGAF